MAEFNLKSVIGSLQPINEQQEITEADMGVGGFIVQLASLLRWLVSSGALRRFTKEEAEAQEFASILESIDADTIAILESYIEDDNS